MMFLLNVHFKAIRNTDIFLEYLNFLPEYLILLIHDIQAGG